MLARVLVGENGCTGGVQPFVTVSVVKMPVGVDEVLDRIGTNPGESVGDLGACTRKTSVDEKFSVAAWEDGDIPPEPMRTLMFPRNGRTVMVAPAPSFCRAASTRP